MSPLEFSQLANNYATVVTMGATCAMTLIGLLTLLQSMGPSGPGKKITALKRLYSQALPKFGHLVAS